MPRFRLIMGLFRRTAWTPWLLWGRGNHDNKAKEKRSKPKKHQKNTGVLLKSTQEIPDLLYYMPPSIYGSCIMAPLILPSNSLREWFNSTFWPYILLVINYVVQFLFIYSVVMITNSDESCKVGLNKQLLVGSLFAFVCTVMMDIQDTFDLADVVIRQIPVVDVTESLKFKCEAPSDRHGHNELTIIGGGFTVLFKVIMTVLILVPKFLCGCALLYAGCMYLVHSDDNTDVILNCLALVFILEVDEIIYEFLLLPYLHRLLEALPPFKSRKEPVACWKHISTPCKFVVVSAICVFFLLRYNSCVV